MKKYKVTIIRTTHTERVFEVEANNDTEAHDKAVEVACDSVWEHDNPEYDVDSVECEGGNNE